MEHTDYQVLAPDSVAWYIQAALVADRTGNVAARDLALDEAQRIAEQRRLIDHLAPLPGYDVAHECNGVRLAEIERRLEELGKIISSLHEHQVLDARRVEKLEGKLAAFERRQWEDAETFGEHARQIDALETAHNRLVLSAATETTALALQKRLEYLERRAQGITGPDAGL